MFFLRYHIFGSLVCVPLLDKRRFCHPPTSVTPDLDKHARIVTVTSPPGSPSQMLYLHKTGPGTSIQLYFVPPFRTLEGKGPK